MDKKNTTLEEDFNSNEHPLVTESFEDYPFIAVSEAGRKYRTTFTKKFENRKPWVRPNPEEIKSYIPGTVDQIEVKKGQEVKLGDELMYYVAMKMRNVIRAPFDGKVADILVKEGDRLPKGQVMIIIKQKQVSEKELKRKELEMVKKEKELEKKAKAKQKRLFEQAAAARKKKK